LPALREKRSMQVLKGEYKQELMRTLSVSDLVIYGMVFMLPIAPFALYGIIGHVANGLVPLVYALSAVAMAFTARSYMVMSKEFPLAGSVYTYTCFGINEVAGFFAGWLVFLDYIICPGLLSVISAAAMNSLVPFIPRWTWILLFIAFGTSLNLVGINLTAKANRLMLYGMMLVLAIFLAVGLAALYGGKGHGHLTFASLYTPSAFSWSAIATGVLIGSTNFLGFDAITTLGEEVRQDQKHLMGFAGLLTLAIIAILFIAQTWLAADLAPGAHVISPDTAFYDISRYAGGNGLFALTSISTALAFGVPCTIVCQSAITRIIYAMGRDGQFPRVFAKVHPKTKQPYVANLFVAGVSLLVALVFQNRIDDLALFQNFGALSAFLLVNASLIGYFWVKQGSRNLVSHMVLPLLGFLIVAALLFAMRPATLRMGVTWLAIGTVYYVTMRFAFRRAVAIEV
jgi:amino acid transporter